MQILHTAHSYSPELSGVSQVVSQISRRLVMRGHSVTVFTGRPPNTPPDETLAGVRIRRFKNSGSLIVGIGGDQRLYLEAVRSGSWDLIVMHCLQTWSTDLLLSHLESVKVPSIIVAHGGAYGNPVFANYYAWLARQLPNVSATVGLSSKLEDAAFARDYGLPPPRVIPNGVDLAEWATPPLQLRSRWGLDSRSWVVNVSNHNANKGHDKLWPLASALRVEEPQAAVTLIGGTHPAARLRLGKVGVLGGCWYSCLARRLLRPSVRLIRRLPRRGVVSAIKEADVFVLPSRWEASPVSILESMAAGTPWVSFDVGCVRENKGGIIVRDVAEMAIVTREILQRRELRASLAAAGIAEATARHDWERIVEQYESLYLNVISGRSQ